jgi:hypothetical protein
MRTTALRLVPASIRYLQAIPRTRHPSNYTAIYLKNGMFVGFRLISTSWESMAVFLFTGVGITPLMYGQLRSEHHWEVWTGSFEDVLPYVRDSWDAVVEDSSETIDLEDEGELVSLVRYLSDPDPLRRGHPANHARNGSRYGPQRFVSRFDFLAARAEWVIDESGEDYLYPRAYFVSVDVPAAAARAISAATR